jgi:hypothetical protein
VSVRHLAFPLVILSLAPLLSTSARARDKHSSSLAVPDRGYSFALAAANRFLQAWQNQDRETGLLMLTDAAKQASSQQRTDSFFSSGNDAAYDALVRLAQDADVVAGAHLALAVGRDLAGDDRGGAGDDHARFRR